MIKTWGRVGVSGTRIVFSRVRLRLTEKVALSKDLSGLRGTVQVLGDGRPGKEPAGAKPSVQSREQAGMLQISKEASGAGAALG